MTTTLDLDFTITTTLDPRITFSRASLATYFDSAGVLKYAGHNNFWWSEDLTNATWQKATGSVTITADATTDPNGTTTADRLNHTATGTTAATHVFQNINPVWTDRCLVSIYAKAGSKPFLMIGSSGANATFQIWFNLATGALGTVGAGAGVISGAIADAGNGWYRCSALMTAAGWGGIAYFHPGESNGVINCTSPGDIYLWGAQAEFVTTETTPRAYIKTPGGAAVHGPRFDYDPVSHVAKGLLIEEARATLGSYNSQNFSSSTKFGSTVTVNSSVAPDGTTTSNLITATATPAAIQLSNPAATGTTYTLSIFAKKGTSDWFYISAEVSGVDTPKAYFNLATGTIGTIDSPITAATIQDVGGGWYRCTATRVGIAGSETLRPGLCDANGSDAVTTGRTVYLWGAQAENGAFASSYIPVTGGGSRAADIAVMTGSNFSSWYNQPAGTFVAECDVIGPKAITGGLNAGIAVTDDGTAANQVSLRIDCPTNTYRAFVTSAAHLNLGTVVFGVVEKLGVSYAPNDVAACRNGGTVLIDTSTSIPAPTQLRIGYSLGDTTNYLNGHIRRIQFQNVKVDDATLQAAPQPPTGTTTPVEPVPPAVGPTTSGGSAFWDQDYDDREYDSSRKRRKRFLDERARRVAELE